MAVEVRVIAVSLPQPWELNTKVTFLVNKNKIVTIKYSGKKMAILKMTQAFERIIMSLFVIFYGWFLAVAVQKGVLS